MVRLSDAISRVNYTVKASRLATDGILLVAKDTTKPSKAAFAYDGQGGVFDISIDYFDEADGQASMALRVDGKEIGSWVWNTELGGDAPGDATRATKTFAGVTLTASSVIELVGQAAGGEPIRVEALRVETAPAPVPAPPPSPSVESFATSAAASVQIAAVSIEAEAAATIENFSVRSLSAASGGSVLQATNTLAASRASFAFNAQAGSYDISVDYFDENDGLATTTLRVDGVDVGTWTWNQNLGSATAGAATRTSKTFEGVSLNPDSVVELVGRANGGEPLRIDAVRFDPVEEPEAPASTIYRGAIRNSADAFVGAEGFGSDTGGGRGGQVVHVTNLADSGVGSLRWALETVSGPRIVVFDVEGRIALQSEISVTDPFVTIAGQTAPGQGVVVSGARISIETHDVIMRGMKIRSGDEAGDQGKNRDNVALGGNGDKGVANVVIDHNSFTWSIDESVGVWGTVRNVTISNNIVAESLQDSIHIDEGKTMTAPHSMGMIVGHSSGDPNSQNISILKNLFVSNEFRNAFIKQAFGVEFNNNYVVNYGAGHSGLALGGGAEPMTIAVIGNVYEDGQNTRFDTRPAFDLRSLNIGSSVYLFDNYVEGHRESSTQSQTDAAHGRLGMVTTKPIFLGSGAVVLTSDRVTAHVLENAGARLAASGLDAVDARIVAQVKAGSSKIIDSQKEVGGYDVYRFVNSRVIDTDRDGMPDWFESAFANYGFDVRVADDKLDYDDDGFSNVEEYINGLIDGFDFL